MPVGERRCPDCGQLRIVGHNDDSNDVWCCVNPNCPPEVFGVAGPMSFEPGDEDTLYVGTDSIVRQLKPFEGKQVYLSVRVYGQGHE